VGSGTSVQEWVGTTENLGTRSLPAQTRFRTPPTLDLLPGHHLSAPLDQMLALGDQTLMDRTGEHRGAVPPDLIAEVLAGDADGTRASRTPSGWPPDGLRALDDGTGS